MPRLPRFNIVGLPQHIIQRGNNRQVCFFEADDYICYLVYLREAAAKTGCDVHAYVLMSNHVHLLVTPQRDDAIPQMMQAIGRRYVQHINRRNQRTGTLWEGRYKASLVESDRYLLTCYRYIELNPVRARGMVADPANYRWSSHKANAYGEGGDWLTPHPLYQRLGETPAERQRAYRDLFSKVLSAEVLSDIQQSTAQGVVLGGERFRQEIQIALKIRTSPGKRGRPRKTEDEV
jgi:putative transposase